MGSALISESHLPRALGFFHDQIGPIFALLSREEKGGSAQGGLTLLSPAALSGSLPRKSPSFAPCGFSGA